MIENNIITFARGLLFEAAGLDNEDISQAQSLTSQSTQQDFIKAVGVDPKLFFRIYHTLYEVIWNNNGTLTKFARDYNIRDFVTFYNFLKDIKQLIKRDQLVRAWEPIREMSMVAYPKLLGKKLFNDPIHAYNFVQRTIWMVLDDLNILKKAFKIMENMEKTNDFKMTMLSLEKKFNAGIQKNEQ